MNAKTISEVAKIGPYFIETKDPTDVSEFVWLRKDGSSKIEGPFDMETITVRLPELSNEENICSYAAVMLYLGYGHRFMPLFDFESIKKFYSERIGNTDYYDISHMLPPYVERGKVVFVVGTMLAGISGCLHLIKGPFPFRHGEFFETLPFPVSSGYSQQDPSHGIEPERARPRYQKHKGCLLL
ncbi:MAG: hypothetical protein LBF26_03190 [Puniceicoccales bacterium]|jgi:hypothetical protein|nr:hypothetical protein [Puniceicoccales bacterium]